MTRKCIILFTSSLSLCGLTMVTTACPPPDCPDCYYWNGSSCVPCDECYKCVDGDCVACKCWDTGTPIVGSINVQNAKLCEQKTHTSSVSDTDHWFKPGVGEGHPADSLTYSWTASDGTPLSSNAANFAWRAPPCIQEVKITLRVDDVPNSMDDPCPGSTRDDPYVDFQGTSTVSLPDGCSEGSSQAISFASHMLTGEEHCGTSCGRTGPMYPPTITIPLPTYYDCKWIFSVYADGNTPCVVCPHLFTEIEDGNDPDINEDNLCDIYNTFSAASPTCPPYGNSTCIQKHEDAHYIEWLDFLEAEQTAFLGDPSISDMTIDCDDATTTTCQAAASARESAIVTAVYQAWARAVTAWYDTGDTLAIEAAAACFEDLINSICSVWNCGNCMP